MASDTLAADAALVYNNSNTSKATAVTVTANYSSTTLKASNYGNSVATISAAGRTKGLSIEGNAKNNKIIGTSGNDTINGAAGNDTLTGGSGSDVFIFDGKGKDVITDYTAGEDTLKISTGTISTYSFSGSDAAFKIGSGTVKISGGKSKAITVVDAKNKIFTYDSGLIYDGATAKAKSVTVTAAYSSNTLSSYGASVAAIDASARTKALNIVGNKLANKITGTGGNDTINGGAGNDTLTGGKGKDVFVYETGGGTDVITDYTANEDTIKISSGTVSNYSISGSDAVFKIDSGSIKVTGGKTKAVLVVDANKNTATYQNGAIYNNAKTSKATAITLTSAYGNAMTAASSVISVDASPRTATVNLTGNAKNNFLAGGKGKDVINGGAGNDTISGGGGSDILTGGKGADVFVYANGDGTDVIMDYVAGEDFVKLTSGAVTGYSVKNGDAVLKIGSGAITLKGAGSGAVSVLDANNVLTVYNGGLIYNNPKIASADAVTVTADFDGDFNSYGASVETIDASARNKALDITGNGADNFILGGKGKDTISGGKGNDSISGGKGNDLLTGGDGSDVFYFSGADGNDTVTDYTAGEDIISVSGEVSYSTKNSDAVLKIGTGNVTVQNAADMAIEIVGANGTASIARGGKITELDSSATIPVEQLPGDVFEYSGHYYYIYDKGATWSEAEAFCESLGGHLLTVTDAEEQTFVESLLAAHENPRNSYWLGAYKNADNNWNWITGENMSYTNWATYEPDNYGEIENRAVFYNVREFGKWNDLPESGEIVIWGADIFGTENLGLICEWDGYVAGNIPLNGALFNSAKTSATISSIFSDTTFDAADFSSLVSIDASAQDGINIVGNSQSNVIKGSAGNDTITGGDGSDTFIYAGGGDFDIITDYTEGEDIISIGANSVTGDMVVGNDVIFAIGDGILKLEGAKDKHVTIHSNDAVIEYFTEYVNDSVSNEETVPADTGLIFNSDKTAVTITTAYNYNSFNVENYPGLSTVTNQNDYISVYGAATGDSVYNSGKYVEILTGDGADSIENKSGGVKLNTGSGNDYIFNDLRNEYNSNGEYGYVTLDGGGGNDTISGYYMNSSVVGNAGDDLIEILDGNQAVTINAGKGDDRILLEGSAKYGAFIQYAQGDGNDVINGFISIDSIQIADGTYSTQVSGSNIIVNVGSEKITITGAAGISTLNILGTYDSNVGGSENSGDIPEDFTAVTLTTGADRYTNSDTKVVIYALAGNDAITNTSIASSAIIYGGDGKDEIFNYGSSVTIDAGDYDNCIQNAGDNVTISASYGNDDIDNFSNGGNIYKLSGGTDTIYGYNENDTIYVGSSSYTTQKSGEDFVISSGSDSLILKYCANLKITVKNSAGNVQTLNSNDSRVMNGSSLGDYILNTNIIMTIDAGNGNDHISNLGDNITISAVAGDDYIWNSGSSVKIYAGDGNDVVFLYPNSYNVKNNTISGGAGNDKIYLNSTTTVGNVFQYSTGDGNDVVYNLTSYDTIQISGSYSTQASGSDIIVSVGSGSITLKDYSGNANIQSVSNGSAPVDLFADDNFVGADLDELVETSIANSAGDLSMRGSNSLEILEPPAITFSGDK